MSERNVTAIKRALVKRASLVMKVDAVDAFYQPKLDKLITAREKRTSKDRAKIRDLTTDIKTRIYKLDGGELSTLRRTYPSVKELS